MDEKMLSLVLVVVDLEGQKPLVKRIKVDMPREFIKRSLDYNKRVTFFIAEFAGKFFAL